jgi:ATP-dependent DNA helicase RecG
MRSAEATFEALCNGPLEAFRLTLLHGRQSPAEKQFAMDDFVSGRAQVLVATGIVEVGIDVPNATVMTIESAERFGLSQLHQLRGRVGRGRHPGFVCAFASDDSSAESKRLQTFADIDDGFELAQMDLQMRGPGNLLSTRQTGFPPLRIADLIQDERTLIEVRDIARDIVEADPKLTNATNARLRRLVVSRYAQVLELSDVG